MQRDEVGVGERRHAPPQLAAHELAAGEQGGASRRCVVRVFHVLRRSPGAPRCWTTGCAGSAPPGGGAQVLAHVHHDAIDAKAPEVAGEAHEQPGIEVGAETHRLRREAAGRWRG